MSDYQETSESLQRIAYREAAALLCEELDKGELLHDDYMQSEYGLSKEASSYVRKFIREDIVDFLRYRGGSTP